MASPAEIVDRWDAKMQEAANDEHRRPCGYILTTRPDGTPSEMAVWLPPGHTPASLGLKTFRKEKVAS